MMLINLLELFLMKAKKAEAQKKTKQKKNNNFASPPTNKKLQIVLNKCKEPPNGAKNVNLGVKEATSGKHFLKDKQTKILTERSNLTNPL